MGHLGVSRQADDHATSTGIPIRSAEANKGRHEVDAIGVVHRRHQLLDIRRRFDRLKTIAQPLHCGASHEHRSLKCVGGLAANLPRHRRQQALLRRHRLVAGVEQHEAAGAIGVLRRTSFEARLAEERRLLVAGIARDRDRRAKPLRVGVAIDLAGGLHFRQHLARHIQQFQQLVVPLHGVDVEQQCAAGVADVGDVDLATSEPPDQERVDGAEQHFTARGARPQAIVRIEQVLDLGTRKVSIDDQAGLLAERRLVAVGLQSIANRRGHAALPDDGVGNRLAGGLVPQDRRLALVGDADGGNVSGGETCLADGILRGLQLGRPNCLGVVLNMAGAREDLRELLLRGRLGLARSIEDDGTA